MVSLFFDLWCFWFDWCMEDFIKWADEINARGCTSRSDHLRPVPFPVYETGITGIIHPCSLPGCVEEPVDLNKYRMVYAEERPVQPFTNQPVRVTLGHLALFVARGINAAEVPLSEQSSLFLYGFRLSRTSTYYKATDLLLEGIVPTLSEVALAITTMNCQTTDKDARLVDPSVKFIPLLPPCVLRTVFSSAKNKEFAEHAFAMAVEMAGREKTDNVRVQMESFFLNASCTAVAPERTRKVLLPPRQSQTSLSVLCRHLYVLEELLKP